MICASACAATVVAWNGVYFAEMANRAPLGRIAQANGGIQFVTFFGGMVGPVLFGLGVSASGSYGLPLALCSLLPAAAGLSFLHAYRVERAGKRLRAQ
ncbi:MAG: hypothetical protein EBX68_11265 [Betaproteobacteria bacterium]|nr:hypothetical protein [Betaproteobacteria bacterium]